MRAVLVVFASLFFALAAQGERPDVPFSVAERIRQLSDQRLMRDLLRTSRTPVTAAAAPSTEFRAQHPDARPRRRRTMTELLAWEIHRFSQRILEGMDELSRDVNRELQQVEKNLQALHVAQQRLPGQLRFGLRLDRMVTAVHEVDAMFRKMSSLMKGSGWSEHTLRRFAQDVLSHGPGSLSEQLQVMHHDLLDTVETHGREGILQLVLRAVQNYESIVCNLRMSPQQVLHNIYTLVALAELKGYAMMQYSLTLQRYFTNESFHAEEELLRETTEQRSTEKVAATIAAMKTAGRQVWRCDPEKHVENETFVQLTELLQGYVQNERDLNSDQACTSTCGYYTYTKVFSCSDAELCYRQRLCRGKVVKCEPLGMSGSVCLSEQRHRRYDRLVFSDTRGPAPTCSTPAVLLNSWYQLLLLKKCSYCFCVCDEDGPYSDRHFSLRPAVSDVDAGFVVIGVRIVKLNRVIHLQVQQAKVEVSGLLVNVSSAEWVPVEAFSLEGAKKNVDFHQMGFFDRAFDLDVLVAPPGYVLTGIRFRRIGTHLNPEIRVTPIDLRQGTLSAGMSIWFGNDNTASAVQLPRTRLELPSLDVPSRAAWRSRAHLDSDRFLYFEHSDVLSDAAQSTVPFVDAQSVAPRPPVLLSGAGTVHRGAKGSAGFVGLRVVTYDFGQLLALGLPEGGADSSTSKPLSAGEFVKAAKQKKGRFN